MISYASGDTLGINFAIPEPSLGGKLNSIWLATLQYTIFVSFV